MPNRFFECPYRPEHRARGLRNAHPGLSLGGYREMGVEMVLQKTHLIRNFSLIILDILLEKSVYSFRFYRKCPNKEMTQFVCKVYALQCENPFQTFGNASRGASVPTDLT